MIGYAMVGTSDLDRSVAFYNIVLAPLGLVQAELEAAYCGYAPEKAPGAIEFYVTEPFDGLPATAGNGTMIAFQADTRDGGRSVSQTCSGSWWFG
jgi:hypothetical protein